MDKIKPYILPVSIVLGLLIHNYASYITPIVPGVVFAILLLNFCAVDIKELKFSCLDAVLMVFQTVMSIGGYLALRAFADSEVLAQAWLIGVLTPVAASVVVVVAALGGNRAVATAYTVYGNALVAVIAPLYFSFIGTHQDMSFGESFLQILSRIAGVIVMPFVVAAVLQFVLPKVKSGIARFKEWALPLWAFAMMTTLGQTIDYIYLYHEGNGLTIAFLALIALVLCLVQFGVGRLIGRRFGYEVACGQLCGQKNCAIGIWMASIYLLPLSSVVLAFYIIFQNIFNSWQMWNYARRNKAAS